MERVDTLLWSVPAPSLDSVRYGAASGMGVARTVNEDTFLVAPPVFLVADGMGGHRSGDVASRLVADRFELLVGAGEISVERVRDCITECQAAVAALSDTHGDGRAPGSTLVVAVLVNHDGANSWMVANLGDSRAYRLADRELVQISHDHSVVQEMIDSGHLDADDARQHPQRNVITRAIGLEGVAADYSLLTLGDGCRLLLCSDGVSSALGDAELARILADATDVGDAARRLVADAHRAGGTDDATAVVIEVSRAAASSHPAQADVDTTPAVSRA